MPLGMITLLVILALVYFGTAQRILDRMRLTDKQAIILLLAIGIGSFVDIPIMSSPSELTINIGGALIPIVLCIWLIIKADTIRERLRAIISGLIVGTLVFVASRYMPNEPETMFIDPKILYGVTAGLIAYAAGRSRRSAFIGGVLGIVLSDLLHLGMLLTSGIVGTTAIGGAGAFDVIMIAGLVAVMTAECIGEVRERIAQKDHLRKRHMADIYEFSEELTPSGKERKLRMISKHESPTQSNQKGES